MKLLKFMVALLSLQLVALPAFAGDDHEHADDRELGHWMGQINVVFEPGEVFSLEPTSGILEGWTGDEPGFVTVDADEPDEELLAFPAGTQLVLEIVSLDPALKAHTPGFVSVLTSPGDTWNMPAIPFDDHPVWHIDVTDPGFDPMQTEWVGVFRILDVGTTAFMPSENFSISFTNLPPAEDFVRGDGNADGVRDVSDIVFALDALFAAGPMGECEDALDANDDGFFNIADPIELAMALFEPGSMPLPGPGPTCGADTTDDGLSCAEHDACL